MKSFFALCVLSTCIQSAPLFAADRIACSVVSDISDETGKLIGQNMGGVASDSAIFDLTQLGTDQTWTLSQDAKYVSFKAEWRFGHSCIVDMSPGCSNKYIVDRPDEFSRIYTLTLVSKEDGTEVQLADAYRVTKAEGPIGSEGTPVFKIKLKKPMHVGPARTVGSKEEYITAYGLKCFRGSW